MHLVILCCAA